MNKPTAIPSHHNQLESSDFVLMPLAVLHEKQAEIHRDDHYMFVLQRKGEFALEVDFKLTEMKEASLCYVAPGQIHQYIHQKNNDGWFLFMKASVIPENYREILDLYQWIHQVITVDKNDVIFELLPILEKAEKDPSLYRTSATLSVAESIVGMITLKIRQTSALESPKNGQKYSITREFKKLINEYFFHKKQVQQYAQLLSITPLYLNEVVKEVTGYPASFWIQQKILWEARRLLFYTTMDVKQIAFELGYEDPVYFSRFLKKGIGKTALQFRTENQDLSHHHH
ncbi:helix-turn-helix domain-containing protein [Elizabethkingia ursingii]|uniref:AraC family transcriptional regulator n=1 Tax=Elizabethkingia ursingii TaxID=1756150 RepID=UPI0020126B13|nr:helix-turn-helix domain-containing protein [Elizabethkingia ursingii]